MANMRVWKDKNFVESKRLGTMAIAQALKHNNFVHEAHAFYAQTLYQTIEDKTLGDEIFKKIDFKKISKPYQSMANSLRQLKQ